MCPEGMGSKQVTVESSKSERNSEEQERQSHAHTRLQCEKGSARGSVHWGCYYATASLPLALPFCSPAPIRDRGLGLCVWVPKFDFPLPEHKDHRVNTLSTADTLHHHCKLGGGSASIPGTSVYGGRSGVERLSDGHNECSRIVLPPETGEQPWLVRLERCDLAQPQAPWLEDMCQCLYFVLVLRSKRSVCVLLLQDLLQNCSREGGRRVEDMSYERR